MKNVEMLELNNLGSESSFTPFEYVAVIRKPGGTHLKWVSTGLLVP